jgi:hypothetical protein
MAFLEDASKRTALTTLPVVSRFACSRRLAPTPQQITGARAILRCRHSVEVPKPELGPGPGAVGVGGRHRQLLLLLLLLLVLL